MNIRDITMSWVVKNICDERYVLRLKEQYEADLRIAAPHATIYFDYDRVQCYSHGGDDALTNKHFLYSDPKLLTKIRRYLDEHA